MALGEKRSHSLFAIPTELHEKETIVPSSTREILFAPQIKEKDFATVLAAVREHISGSYPGLISQGDDEARAQIRRYTLQFLQDQRLGVKGYTPSALADALYAEMAEFGFLTKYIYGEGVEEIDVNAWDDVEVQYSGGQTIKLGEHFDSPGHAVDMIRRMLHVSDTVMDNASPIVLGHLRKNIRIAAIKAPIVDEDVGVAASIRIVNPQSLSKEDFISGGTATEPMLDFLSLCVQYGISVCVAGATSSGKTTVAGWLMTTVPDDKRVYTIENGSRELALVRKIDGKTVNSVIHTLARDSDDERQKVDQIDLLDMALRFNPDVVVVGEMRGPEAYTAQEAARTGVAVVTTIHSNSCEATYRRMVSLCKRAVDMGERTLMDYVTEAYPIVVFCKQLGDRSRKLMEIMECEILPSGERHYRTLFRYVTEENRVVVDKVVIQGHHEQVERISYSLARHFMENGMPTRQLEALTGKSEVKTT